MVRAPRTYNNNNNNAWGGGDAPQTAAVNMIPRVIIIFSLKCFHNKHSPGTACVGIILCASFEMGRKRERRANCVVGRLQKPRGKKQWVLYYFDIKFYYTVNYCGKERRLL